MKIFRNIALVMAAGAMVTGCVDKDVDESFFPNPEVDFTYNVAGDEYPYDFYVVSTIQFNNTSSASGNFTWDFGDGTTSTEVSPTHKYESAGTYRVRLTHDTKGTREYPILIYDIAPVLSMASCSTETVEFNTSTVTFSLELPNPENLPVRYEWSFPEGTVYEDGSDATSFVGTSDAEGNIEYPAPVMFKNIGSQTINLRTYFDTTGENRRLDDVAFNVQVGLSEPAPTLYYAVRNGNIKALKLVDNLPAGTKLLPFDMGVSSGATVFNILYADVPAQNEEGETVNEGWIYILDAGKQYYYVNDENGVLGDGKINVMRTDGTNVNTMLTNVGGAAFLDPFIGCVYGDKLYYTDRNTGCSSIELKTRGAVQGKKSSTERDSYAWTNNTIPYYGRPLGYGSISNGLWRDSAGWWWWGKKYNGNCIVRFRDSDIYNTQADADAAASPAKVVLNGAVFSTFAIDDVNKGLYIWERIPQPGFKAYDLPGTSEDMLMTTTPKAYIAMDADPVNTTDAEGLLTTQMAVDKTNGRVYFCFRPAPGSTEYAAGIYYYDPADLKIHKYGETSDAGTGITINPNPTKLF